LKEPARATKLIIEIIGFLWISFAKKNHAGVLANQVCKLNNAKHYFWQRREFFRPERAFEMQSLENCKSIFEKPEMQGISQFISNVLRNPRVSDKKTK